jgi:hypothetical protein
MEGQQPNYQRIFQFLGYIFGGMVVAGSALSIYEDSRIVPPWLTYIATFVAIAI